jgi:hypothetical protein
MVGHACLHSSSCPCTRPLPHLPLPARSRLSALPVRSRALSLWFVGPCLSVLSSPNVHAHVVDSVPMTHVEAAPAPPRPFLKARTPTTSPSSLFRVLAELQHSRRTARTTEKRCRRLQSPWSPRRVCCLGNLCLDVCDPDTPQFVPSPSISLCPCSPDLPPRSCSATAVDPSHLRASTAVQGTRRLPSR